MQSCGGVVVVEGEEEDENEGQRSAGCIVHLAAKEGTGVENLVFGQSCAEGRVFVVETSRYARTAPFTAVTGTAAPLARLCEYEVSSCDVGFFEREVEVSQTRELSRAVPKRDVIQVLMSAYSFMEVNPLHSLRRWIEGSRPAEVNVNERRQERRGHKPSPTIYTVEDRPRERLNQ